MVSKLKITFSDSALNELDDIKQYYSELGVPHVGTEFITSIICSIEHLSDNPDMGRIVPEFNMSDIRELIHNPYRVVYLREPKKITVIRIWRSERLLNLNGTPAKNQLGS